MRKIFEFKSNWAKIAPLVFAIVTFPLAFEQCRNRDEPKSKVTILFWHSLVASSVPALSDLLKKFHEEHTGIEVKAQYIPTGDALIQKLITAIQSRTTPDVSWIHSNYLEHLVQSDAIYPMEKFINGPNGFTTEEMDDFFPAMLQLASWNKTLYSLPMEATNLGLLYNRELFRSAGLDPDRPPQTWEELREFAKKLTIDNDGDGKLEQIGFWVPVFPSSGPLFTFMVWQWYPFLWQAGGYEINLEQTKVLFDSDAGVKALALWKNIHKDLGLASFTIDYDVAFISKKLAMALDGPWNLPRYRELKNLDWTVASLPAGPFKRATNVGGEFFAIFRQSQHPDETWTFVKWVARPENQALWSMKSGYLPVRRSVLNIKEYRDFLDKNPGFKAYVEQMDVAQTARPMDYHTLQITRHVAEAIEKATIGGMDPKKVLEEAAMKSNKLLSAVSRR